MVSDRPSERDLGVSFLVWDTEDCVRVTNGVPTAEALKTAVPEPCRGNQYLPRGSMTNADHLAGVLLLSDLLSV